MTSFLWEGSCLCLNAGQYRAQDFPKGHPSFYDALVMVPGNLWVKYTFFRSYLCKKKKKKTQKHEDPKCTAASMHPPKSKGAVGVARLLQRLCVYFAFG